MTSRVHKKNTYLVTIIEHVTSTTTTVGPGALLDERHHGDVATREVRRGGGQAGGKGRVRGALSLGQVGVVPRVALTLAALSW